MEPPRRELLARCQQSLAQAMTDVEAVLGLLEAAGALSPGERRRLDAEAGGSKAERLLQLLLAKERDPLPELRAALEKTQPHLLPILYLNGVVGPPQPAEGAGECPARPAARPASAASLSGPRRGAGRPRSYLARPRGQQPPFSSCRGPRFTPPPGPGTMPALQAWAPGPGLQGPPETTGSNKGQPPGDRGGMSVSPISEALHHPPVLGEPLGAFR